MRKIASADWRFPVQGGDENEYLETCQGMWQWKWSFEHMSGGLPKCPKSGFALGVSILLESLVFIVSAYAKQGP